MPILQITKDGFLLQEIEIRSELVAIGREPENDVRLGDLTVSRRHGLLKRHADGRYFIEDLQSRNGISINGHAITQPSTLVDGDQIRVGIYQLTFLDSAEVTRLRQDHPQTTSEKVPPEFVGTMPAQRPEAREILSTASNPTAVQPMEERRATGYTAEHHGHDLEIGVLVNEDSNAIFALEHDQIVLGNEGEVDIRVPGSERTRATIARRGEYFYICSETPTPCVSVNGQPVMNAQLAYNDRIEIGGRRFIFREI
jgi:pSer/pThr/pTyr-binding forkhead associated (FHA) protein